MKMLKTFLVVVMFLLLSASVLMTPAVASALAFSTLLLLVGGFVGLALMSRTGSPLETPRAPRETRRSWVTPPCRTNRVRSRKPSVNS